LTDNNKIKKKMGRPSLYSEELKTKILTRMSAGESIRSVCRDAEMPDITTIFKWLSDADKQDFAQQYARARELQAESLFEELLEVARGKEGSDVHRDRLTVDTMKWVVSKIVPKKYGDKNQVEVSGPDQGPIEVVAISLQGPSNE
jgi:hypothetical protein